MDVARELEGLSSALAGGFGRSRRLSLPFMVVRVEGSSPCTDCRAVTFEAWDHTKICLCLRWGGRPQNGREIIIRQWGKLPFGVIPPTTVPYRL